MMWCAVLGRALVCYLLCANVLRCKIIHSITMEYLLLWLNTSFITVQA